MFYYLDEAIAMPRKRKLSLPIMNARVCEGFNAFLVWARKCWQVGWKKRPEEPIRSGDTCTSKSRWYSWTGWSLVCRAQEEEQMLALDCDLSSNKTDCGLCHWRSQWSNLPEVVGSSERRIKHIHGSPIIRSNKAKLSVDTVPWRMWWSYNTIIHHLS